ncbi:MAG: SpoIIE family protein phosphatase [Acidimicrobiales bacterium]
MKVAPRAPGPLSTGTVKSGPPRRSGSAANSILTVLALAAVAVVISVSLALIVSDYQADQRNHQQRLAVRSRATAQALGDFLGGRLAFLKAAADLPSLSGDPSAISRALKALSDPDVGLSGGVGLADPSGLLLYEHGAPPGSLPVDLSQRDYIRQVQSTRRPVVSDVVRGLISGSSLVVLAVPVVDGAGELTGILVASVHTEDLSRHVPSLAGPDFVQVLDGTGHVVLAAGKAPDQPDGRTGVAPTEPTGVPTGSEPGIGGPASQPAPSLRDGQGDMAIEVDVDGIPGWRLRYQVAYLGTTLETTVEEAALLGILVMLAGVAIMVASRSARSNQRRVQHQADRADSLRRLTDALVAAPDRASLASIAADHLAAASDGAAAVVLVAEPEVARLEVVGLAGPIDPSVAEANRYIPVGADSMAAEVYARGGSMALARQEFADRYPDLAAEAARVGATYFLAARFDAAAVSGVVSVGTRRPPDSVPDALDLVAAMGDRTGEALARLAVTKAEHDASRSFQEAMFPKDLLGPDDRLQRSARYRPASQDERVGGDWYELVRLDDDRIAFAVGDVVGHGLESASVMGQLQSALRAYALAGAEPAEALNRLDEFAQTVPGSLASTVLAGTLDLACGRLRLANAGHLPPILLRDGRAMVLSNAFGLPLGCSRESTRREQLVFDLGNEDLLVVYTDGLVERRDEVLNQGIERLRLSIERHGHRPIERLADFVLADCVDDSQPDDLALVCLRPVGPTPATFSARRPAEPRHLADLRRSIRRWLAGHGEEPEVIDNVLLAVGEAAANSVEHAYQGTAPGPLIVEMRRSQPGVDTEGIHCAVSDRGRWAPVGPAAGRGRGIKMIKAVTAEMTVERTRQGTTVGFSIRRSIPTPRSSNSRAGDGDGQGPTDLEHPLLR